jgi:surface antigen
MKKFILKAVAGLSIVTVLTGCLTNEAGQVNKETVGGLTGAVAGAWIGSNVGKGKGNIVAIAGGTLLGALAGGSLGRSLDKADVAYANRTSQQALEYNKTGAGSSWKNPDTGASGSFVPTKTYQTKDNRYCREYTQTVSIGGKVEKGYGSACRQPDGSWEIVK